MKPQDKPVSFLYFGDELIASEDLDPVYCTMSRAGLDDSQLKRMLLAYWCYYSVGTACRIVEPGPDLFYDKMWQAHEEKWPHGFERRYFYGSLAAGTLDHLEKFGLPEEVVDHMTQHGTFQQASDAVMSHYGFGSWMAFKVTDMAERVLGIPVDFSDSDLGIYKDPVMGAALMLYGDMHAELEDGDLAECFAWLNEDFAYQLAPPHYDRPFNIQEGETLACKYKAYYKRAYYPGKDVKEVSEGLEVAHQSGCDMAQHMLEYMPSLYEPRCPMPYPYLDGGYHPNVCGLDYLEDGSYCEADVGA